MRAYYLGVREAGAGRLPAAARRARAHRPGRGRPLDLPQPRLPGGGSARSTQSWSCTRCGSRRSYGAALPPTDLPSHSASRPSRRSTWPRCCRAAARPVQAEQYEDEYRDRVLDLIKRKAKGEDIAPRAREPEPADDLMGALRRAWRRGEKGSASAGARREAATAVPQPRRQALMARSAVARIAQLRAGERPGAAGETAVKDVDLRFATGRSPRRQGPPIDESRRCSRRRMPRCHSRRKRPRY